MAGEFQGKVAVVTGGSRGIGREIAKDFAGEGAQTVIVSSSQKNLDAASKIVAGNGGPPPLAIAANLKTLEGCQEVLKQVQSKFGRCDILVNCAGATRAGNFVDLPDDAWIDGYALKFFGGVRMSRLFWPLLKAAQGHVINVIGGAARTPGTAGAGRTERRWSRQLSGGKRLPPPPDNRKTARPGRSRRPGARPLGQEEVRAAVAGAT